MSEVSVASRGDRFAVVIAVGEFDYYTAGTLRDALANEIADAAHRMLVVDLTAVTFMDSTALGVLVGAHKRMQANGGSMRLVCANQRVLKMFEITALTRVFEIRSTVDEAVGQVER